MMVMIPVMFELVPRWDAAGSIGFRVFWFVVWNLAGGGCLLWVDGVARCDFGFWLSGF